MENNKKIIITVLSVLVVAMAVGYALLTQELTINGTASIDSTWKVEITNITSKDVVGDAVNKVDPSYTATTANFSVGFTQPGDSITYDITVTNKGTLDAVVESINVNKGDNPAITYTTSGLKRGDKITKNNGTNTLTVKVDYDSNVTSQPASTTNNITVTINYQQDLGQVPAYETYSIGDTVQFAGSNWYVIKDSTAEEDYVTLMKEIRLTNQELGDYAYDSTNDIMEYTWTDTCHNANHGYSSAVWSNCNNTNSYATSKVKEMLETRYMPTIDPNFNKLKEINGYKIRIITVEELQNNLGWRSGEETYVNVEGNNVPDWVHQKGYWVDAGSSPTAVWVWNNGASVAMHTNTVFFKNNDSYDFGVRPVINLLKSAIE